MALYRKYRSATFSEVIGQEHVTGPLMQALSAGRINHAYLFSGPRGCGKTSSARILARSLNCAQGPTPTPCGVCDSCRDLAPNGSGSIDVIEIDAASHGGVDDARDLRERAYYAPARDRYKVYIIDEAHMVTTQGFNALLKLVEEPPDFLVFIFATTEPDKVLQTIRSRTHHYPFRLIPPSALRAHLERICEAEGARVEPTVFPLVVRAGGGSARDSLSILDQLLAGAGAEGVTYAMAVGLLGVTDSALLDDMIDSLAVGDASGVYATIDRVVEAGHDPRRFAADLLERFRDLMVLDAVPDALEKGLIDYPSDQVDRMAEQSRRIGTASLVRFADIAHTTLTDMRGTTSPRLMLELLCARMLLPDAAADSAALLQRLERLERRQSLGLDAPTEHAVDRPTAPPRPVASEPVAASRPVASEPMASAGRPGGSQPPWDTTSPDSTVPDPASAKPAEPALPAPMPVTPQAVAPKPAEPAQPPIEPTPPPIDPATHDAPAAAGGPAPEPDSPAPNVEAPVPVASVPVPAIPAPTVGEAAGDSAGLRRIWPDVLEQVKSRSRRTHALLDHASISEVKDTLITLSVTSAPIAKMISDDSNLSVLRDALTAVVGGGWRIEVTATAAAEQRPSLVEPEPVEPPPARERPTRPVRAVPNAAPPGPPPAEDDGVDEAGDAVEGSGPGAMDPESAAMELLQSQLGARPIES